jgi:hypothetical protein
MMDITQDHTTVLGTLPFRPTGDEEASFATAAAVTEVVPFGADKTRRLLADLIQEGLVEVNPESRTKAYRRATTEDEAWIAYDDTQAQRAVGAAESAEVQDAGDAAAGAPTVALGVADGSSVASVREAMRAARPVPAHDHAEDDAPKTGTCSVCGKPITKKGRSWDHDDGDVGHKATTAKQRETRAAGERPADAPPIYAKGALKDKILAWLRQQPEGEAFSATQVAKAVEGQNGSVQFALDSFVAKGEAKLTQEKPKRYAAA